MNERIAELAEQSGINFGEMAPIILKDELEEFAELLIRECANVADRNYDSGFCPVGGFIKEHFDIK